MVQWLYLHSKSARASVCVCVCSDGPTQTFSLWRPLEDFMYLTIIYSHARRQLLTAIHVWSLLCLLFAVVTPWNVNTDFCVYCWLLRLVCSSCSSISWDMRKVLSSFWLMTMFVRPEVTFGVDRTLNTSWISLSRQPHTFTSGRITHPELFYTSSKHKPLDHQFV